MNNKILKEVFIIFLLVVVIMFAFAILFYDCISADKKEISSIEYITDEEVGKALKEIQKNSGVDIENESANYLLKSYSINKDDLTVFASENSYESGKKDPFSESAEPVEEIVKTTTINPTKENSESNNSVNLKEEEEEKKTENNKEETKKENTVSEKSTSTTGTFFENKNSK